MRSPGKVDDEGVVWLKKRVNVMRNYIRQDISRDDCINTALALILLLLIITYFVKNTVFLLLSIFCVVLVMVCPKIYAIPAKIWLSFSSLLGILMSRIVLGIIFYCVQTPVALLCRVFGHDPMRLKDQKTVQSSFITQHRRFVADDLKNPF